MHRKKGKRTLPQCNTFFYLFKYAPKYACQAPSASAQTVKRSTFSYGLKRGTVICFQRFSTVP